LYNFRGGGGGGDGDGDNGGGTIALPQKGKRPVV